MAREEIVSTLWRCDYKNCKTTGRSYSPNDQPNGWLSIVGAYQDAHGGGPGYVDLCPKHSTIIHIHRDIDEEQD